MKISVVLCCYNGEKFINQQLESLKVQTRKPDEVLIFDDKSTDGTVECIKKYIAENHLNNWHVSVNTENKGWMKNFMDGMEKSSGDIIFPCDQDDIWCEDKIEKMSQVMEDDKILLLAANYEAFYEGEEYRKISNTFTKDDRNDESVCKVPFNEKALYNMRPGCVMAFRRELLDICLKYSFPNYPHDALLWRTAIIMDGAYKFEYKSIYFRRHASNASDKQKHLIDERVNTIEYYIKVCDKLIQLSEDKEMAKEKKLLLGEIKEFWLLRQKFYQTRSLKAAVMLMTKWNRYYLTLKMALGDIYIVYRGK